MFGAFVSICTHLWTTRVLRRGGGCSSCSSSTTNSLRGWRKKNSSIVNSAGRVGKKKLVPRLESERERRWERALVAEGERGRCKPPASHGPFFASVLRLIQQIPSLLFLAKIWVCSSARPICCPNERRGNYSISTVSVLMWWCMRLALRNEREKVRARCLTTHYIAEVPLGQGT